MTEKPPGPRRALPIPHKIAAVIVALLATFAITITLVDPDGPEGSSPPKLKVTVTKVDADADGKRDDPLTVTPKAAEALDKALDSPKAELDEPLREADDPSLTPPGLLEGPLAADELEGCRTRFVGNYSSRNGVTPQVIGLHQTVSRANGWTSQNALTAMANRRSSGVSWAALVAPVTGYCTYTVPLAMKAWTQANANPFTVGIEVERYGDEPTYVEGAGKAKLVSIIRQIGRRYDIPMRRGKVVNCKVVRPGIVEHSDLGACGGGHADVTPWSIDPVIAAAAAGGSSSSSKYAESRFNLAVLTTAERSNAKRLLAERRIAQRRGGWSKIAPSHLRAAVRAKAWLVDRKAYLAKRLSSKANRAERYRVIRSVVAV